MNIFEAVKKDNLVRVQELINNGTSINEKNSSLETPLHIAVEFGHLEIAQALINNITNLNSENRF